MATYRIRYRVAGVQKEVIWSAGPGEADLATLARWLMLHEFPKRLYRVDKGMDVVLRDHGITDISCPITLYWPKRQPSQW
jgi:hypothetical protein